MLSVEGNTVGPDWNLVQQTKALYETLTGTEVLGLFCFLSSILESSKLQNAGRKQSVSRSLKHLFHSSNKFVKTLKRFVIHFISQTYQVVASSCCSYSEKHLRNICEYSTGNETAIDQNEADKNM